MNTEYEGDYRCEVSGGGRCTNEATVIYREPYTSAQVAVVACGEHADDLDKAGYAFDEQGTAKLARDRERETELV